MDIVQGGEHYVTQGMRGFFLHRVDQARKIMARVVSDNLFLHLDLYHQQIMQGRLAETLRENICVIRHVQFAGVPGRHEPSVGEINYPFLFDLIDELGYRGWVGCEYRPRTGTEAGLAWAERMEFSPTLALTRNAREGIVFILSRVERRARHLEML